MQSGGIDIRQNINLAVQYWGMHVTQFAGCNNTKLINNLIDLILIRSALTNLSVMLDIYLVLISDLK